MKYLNSVEENAGITSYMTTGCFYDVTFSGINKPLIPACKHARICLCVCACIVHVDMFGFKSSINLIWLHCKENENKLRVTTSLWGVFRSIFVLSEKIKIKTVCEELDGRCTTFLKIMDCSLFGWWQLKLLLLCMQNTISALWIKIPAYEQRKVD